MDIDLIKPCIIYLVITLYLFCISKTRDSILLGIMIIGQLILLYGSIVKNNILIEISHIFYTLSILFGVLFFTEKLNNIFLLLIIFITIFTRRYFKDCLFYKINSNTKIIDIDINFDYIYILTLVIIIYKLIKT
jgi:hypothetical protein